MGLEVSLSVMSGSTTFQCLERGRYQMGIAKVCAFTVKIMIKTICQITVLGSIRGSTIQYIKRKDE